MKDAFIKNHETAHSVHWLLELHPSGYYACCKTPQSARALDGRMRLDRIRPSWLESGGVYGY